MLLSVGRRAHPHEANRASATAGQRKVGAGGTPTKSMFCSPKRPSMRRQARHALLAPAASEATIGRLTAAARLCNTGLSISSFPIPNPEAYMNTISDILGSRKGTVISISSTKSVHDALVLMAEHDVSALLVMDQGKLVGIISEKDYARKVVLQGRTSKETKVGEIMVEHDRIHFATLEMTQQEAIRLMSENQIRHLPVVDGKKKVVGVVSIRDFSFIADPESEE
jgi:CBS domain-containing protein